MSTYIYIPVIALKLIYLSYTAVLSFLRVIIPIVDFNHLIGRILIYCIFHIISMI
nr:MAG TPA: hypothetical protein [Caudoviricetes sp.]